MRQESEIWIDMVLQIYEQESKYFLNTVYISYGQISKVPLIMHSLREKLIKSGID